MTAMRGKKQNANLKLKPSFSFFMMYLPTTYFRNRF